MDQTQYRSKFPDTRWSLVLASREGDKDGQKAMEELCQAYWYPLYAYARRSGCSPEKAEDLTQSFFAVLLEKELMKRVDRNSGKLRSYLLATFKNTIHKEWRSAAAQKRGGGVSVVSIERDLAEERLGAASGSVSPEVEFDRHWASVLLEKVHGRLRDSYERRGKASLFTTISPFIGGLAPGEGYSGAAEILGMTEASVRTAVFRIRKRYRALLWEEISETVASPDLIQGEIDDLFAIFEDR